MKKKVKLLYLQAHMFSLNQCLAASKFTWRRRLSCCICIYKLITFHWIGPRWHRNLNLAEIRDPAWLWSSISEPNLPLLLKLHLKRIPKPPVVNSWQAKVRKGEKFVENLLRRRKRKLGFGWRVLRNFKLWRSISGYRCYIEVRCRGTVVRSLGKNYWHIFFFSTAHTSTGWVRTTILSSALSTV